MEKKRKNVTSNFEKVWSNFFKEIKKIVEKLYDFLKKVWFFFQKSLTKRGIRKIFWKFGKKREFTEISKIVKK